MPLEAITALVMGKVQGVWFRKFAMKKAQQLDITGWVENTTDGHVAVYAVGDTAQLDSFIKQLHQGPPLARVKKIDIKKSSIKSCSGFIIKNT